MSPITKNLLRTTAFIGLVGLMSTASASPMGSVAPSVYSLLNSAIAAIPDKEQQKTISEKSALALLGQFVNFVDQRNRNSVNIEREANKSKQDPITFSFLQERDTQRGLITSSANGIYTDAVEKLRAKQRSQREQSQRLGDLANQSDAFRRIMRELGLDNLAKSLSDISDGLDTAARTQRTVNNWDRYINKPNVSGDNLFLASLYVAATSPNNQTRRDALFTVIHFDLIARGLEFAGSQKIDWERSSDVEKQLKLYAKTMDSTDLDTRMKLVNQLAEMGTLNAATITQLAQSAEYRHIPGLSALAVTVEKFGKPVADASLVVTGPVPTITATPAMRAALKPTF